MHLDGANPPDKQQVIEVMQNYGIPVYITELDVNMKNVSGNLEEREEIQVNIYVNMLEACIESGVCKSFVVYGVGDKYSWLETDTVNVPNFSPDADPTLYNDNLKPKLSYYALLDRLNMYIEGEQ